MALINRSLTKKWLLEMVQKQRIGCRCTRIAKSSVERVEQELLFLIKKLPTENFDNYKEDASNFNKIFNKHPIRKTIKTAFESKFPFIKVQKANESILNYLSYIVEKNVELMVRSHPSIGKTLRI